MAPIPVWSGNLRLSLVLVPVRMFPATSSEGAIAFRMIHEPSGQPIKIKGIETEGGFEEVPEDEIIKGYEHTKGHHVLIKPEELDELKLEAKHTIDMARFVDRDEIDSRYFEKPYYLLPGRCQSRPHQRGSLPGSVPRRAPRRAQYRLLDFFFARQDFAELEQSLKL